MIPDVWQISTINWISETQDFGLKYQEFDTEEEAKQFQELINEIEQQKNPKFLASSVEKVFFCDVCHDYILTIVKREIVINYSKQTNIPVGYCKRHTMDEILEICSKKLHECIFEKI